MATHDYVIDNQTAPNFRADLNNALLAIVSNNSNATPPAVTYANMIWYDTATNTLFMRNEDNDAFIKLGTLDQTADTFAAAVALASQAEAETGTNNTKVMTPLRVAQNFAANQQQIGVGQTWQNLLASRSINTVFQNTTGGPIMVSVTSTSSVGNSTLAVGVTSSSLVAASVQESGNLFLRNVQAIVPNLFFYRYSGAGGIAFWAELR